MTHEEFIEFFLEIKRCSVAELTALSYEKCLYRYLPLKASVSDLGLYDAQRIMIGMKNLSAGTQKRNLTVLKQYCAYAVRYEIMKKNPFEGVERPRNVKIDTFSGGVYDDDELAVLMKHIASLNIMWRTFFTLAIDSGMRRGELVALRWSDIDLLKSHSLKISRSAYKTSSAAAVKFKEPKGHRDRTVYISSPTVKLLKKLQLEQKKQCFKCGVGWKSSNFVFSGKSGTGTEPMYPSVPSKYWCRFLERSRLPRRRLHDLRHTSATMLLSHGVDVRTVSGRLGHASLNTTMVYLHSLGGQTAAETMSRIIEKAVTL